jgi:hypothetical protein
MSVLPFHCHSRVASPPLAGAWLQLPLVTQDKLQTPPFSLPRPTHPPTHIPPFLPRPTHPPTSLTSCPEPPTQIPPTPHSPRRTAAISPHSAKYSRSDSSVALQGRLPTNTVELSPAAASPSTSTRCFLAAGCTRGGRGWHSRANNTAVQRVRHGVIQPHRLGVCSEGDTPARHHAPPSCPSLPHTRQLTDVSSSDT